VGFELLESEFHRCSSGPHWPARLRSALT
jgi:hypothetical protein